MANPKSNDEVEDREPDDEPADQPAPTSGTLEYSEAEEDPDDIAAREAREAVEKDASGSESDDDDKGEEDGQEGSKPEEGEGEQPTTIPYGRFQEVNSKLQDARQTISYLSKAMAARHKPPEQPAKDGKSAEQPQSETPPAEDRIQSAYQRIDDAAARFDQGDITLKEFKAAEREAEEEIWQIRQEANRPPPPTDGLGDQEVLERQEQQLYDSHPYLEQFTTDDLRHLAQIAAETAKREGRPYGSGAAETYRLRQHVAQLTDVYGPAWYSQPASNDQGTGQSEQPSEQPTPRTQRQRETAAAVKRSETMPPDISNAGRTADTPEPSDQDIESMTEDEIMELPSSYRQRRLGIR